MSTPLQKKITLNANRSGSTNSSNSSSSSSRNSASGSNPRDAQRRNYPIFPLNSEPSSSTATLTARSAGPSSAPAKRPKLSDSGSPTSSSRSMNNAPREYPGAFPTPATTSQQTSRGKEPAREFHSSSHRTVPGDVDLSDMTGVGRGKNFGFSSLPDSSGLLTPDLRTMPLSSTATSLRAGSDLAPAGVPTLAQSAKPASYKLVIKPFKTKPQVSADYEDRAWKRLREAVNAIFQCRPVPDSLEELYRSCENLCNLKLGARLYQKLQKEFETLTKLDKEKLSRVSPKNAGLYLAAISAAWTSFCEKLRMIRSIFLYLDRTYALKTSKITGLWDLGLSIFRQFVVESSPISTNLNGALLQVVRQERDGLTIDRPVVKNVVAMYTELDKYTESVEGSLLRAAATFYAEESVSRLSQSSPTEIPDYLRYVSVRLAEEDNRVRHYLNPETRRPLIQVLETQLIKSHASEIVEKGFKPMIEASLKKDLKLLFEYLTRVDALELLKRHFSDYVKETGSHKVNDESRDATLVSDLLTFKRAMTDVVEDCFEDTDSYKVALKTAFEHLINVRKAKPAILIAKFIDHQMRSGNAKTSEETLESLIDQALVLFRYVQGKDVFEAFFKRDLAKRLLLGKSASDEVEKSLIAKLKTECGSGFTSSLEGMFTDMALSRDLMQKFEVAAKKKKAGGGKPESIDFTVNVLTQSHWPTYTPIPVDLPPSLSALQDRYKSFYTTLYKGRKLQWVNALGYCLVKAHFVGGKKELSVSLFQAVVLLMFNDVGDAPIEYAQIRSTTGIEDKELKRILQSLACAKVKVLLKSPKGKEVDAETDSFQFNEGLTHHLFRIKINSIQSKDTPDETKQVTERVTIDRTFVIEAAVMRIMKMRKKHTHAALMTELLQMLKFPAQVPDCKRAIEGLIGRDYIARSASDSSVLKYIA